MVSLCCCCCCSIFVSVLVMCNALLAMVLALTLHTALECFIFVYWLSLLLLQFLFFSLLKIKSTTLSNIKCTRTHTHTHCFSRCWFIELLEYGARKRYKIYYTSWWMCIIIEFHSCLKQVFEKHQHRTLLTDCAMPFTALIMNMQNSRCSVTTNVIFVSCHTQMCLCI